MTSLRRLPLCALVTVFLSSSLLFAQQPAPAVRITSPIDPTQLVTLHGSVHPLANALNDRGAAPAGMQLQRLHLILKRSPAQESALRQLIQEQNSPGSPNYHKWLTPAQFGAEFGPSDQDLATVENWLSDQGFTVNKVEPGRQTLDISGTVGLLGTAFHTQIHKYMVNGEMHYANANDPSIPAALAPVVGGFVSLNNFHYHSYAEKLGEATYDPSTGRAKPSWTIGSGSFDYQTYNFVLSPADFAVQYDLPSTLKGDGQTIAIVNESNINIDLVNQFRTLFGLPANPPQVIIDGNDPGIDGINNPDGPNGASVEAYLDVEWAGAIAPNATIDLVIAADTSLENGLALAAEHAVYSDVAPVVSVSFGNCEAFNGSSNAFWNDLWQQAAAQGQTVIVSTGDNGSAGCDFNTEFAQYGQAVNGLASTPYDVAVGGTDFYYSSYSGSDSSINSQLSGYWNTTASNSTPSASIKGYIPEQPWNNSQYGLNLFSEYNQNGDTLVVGGGGGASNAAICPGNSYSASTGLCNATPSGYPKPAWQTGAGVPADGVRDLPDVSLFAANGYNDSYYPICATDGDCQPATSGGTVQIFGVGGTSAAAPAFAGIMALVNQKYGRQGQADTILYPLKAQFGAAFHDVTNGNNSMPCAYSATSGQNTPDCIAVTNPITVQYTNSSGGTSSQLEGQIGTGTTVEYDAGTGYNLATGLGTIDAATLISDWVNVQLPTATITFNATPTTITHGQSVSVSGTVTGTGTPTGNVAIMTDSTEPSQQGQQYFALDGSGNYSGSISTLPGGSYNIWAAYGGDNKNGLGNSAKIPITVNPEASGIAFGLFENGSNQYLTSNISASVDYGTQLMLSARVAPTADVATLQTCTTSSATTCPTYSDPTGTVTFKDNGSALNTAAINSEGDAEYNAPFSIGSHSVSASYSGDNSYSASSTSTPAAITFTVAKDTPQLIGSTTITDTNNDLLSGTGQQTVLTLIVENNAQYTANSNSSSSSLFPVPVAPPTGTITLSGSTIPGVPNGTYPLSTGVDPTTGGQVGIATVVAPANTASGTYQVAVAYSGDSNYNNIPASSNTTFSIPIVNFNSSGGLSSTTTASVSGTVISPNTTITISGTVTGQSGHAAPTGTVYLYSSGNYPTSTTLSTLSGDVASYSITVNSQTLVQGSNQLTVQYQGDNTYNPSAYVITNALSNPLSDFSLVPDSAIVPITVGGSATDNIELASVNNFSGAVTLTCTPPTGITCNVTSPVTLSAGGSATTAVNIGASGTATAQDYNILITAKDTTGEYIHTLNITADLGSPTLNLTNAGTINISAPGGSGTSVFTATPTNGFTGTVNLSCAVTGTPSGASTPITCGSSNLSAASLNITGSTAQTSTLTINTTSSTTVGTYQVTVTGTSGSLTVESVVNVAVAVTAPDFAISNGGNITVKAGATTGNTSTITVQSQNSFNSGVNLTCSISPTASNDPATCSFNNSSITPAANGTATATLTVTTTAATTSMNKQKPPFWPSAGGGAVLACLLFFWIPKKRRGWLAMVVLLVFFVSMAGMACGGGSSSSSGGGGGGGGNSGTTAGTYSITVTGTSGSLSHNTTVTLTVQ